MPRAFSIPELLDNLLEGNTTVCLSNLMFNFGPMKEVDCIIVGQGVAGTLLSFELMQAGLSVLVIDNAYRYGASRVASGVVNPVTGRRVVETWKINELLPLAADTYNRISRLLQIAPVVRSVDVLAIHSSEQMYQAYLHRQQQGSGYIQSVNKHMDYRVFFDLPYDMHVIRPALLIDLQTLLTVYRNYLADRDLLWEHSFDWGALQFSSRAERPVLYHKGDIHLKAKWVIGAEGAAAAHNPYFGDLPFRYNKGEALIIAAPQLPREHIFKLRYSIVPWGSDDLFWIGSTYQWEFDDALPSPVFKAEVVDFLDRELLVPYQVRDHIASVRPASVNRRPFAGLHKTYSQLGILNGLGTKGCSLAPYLALGWKNLLLHGKAFDPEVCLAIGRK